MPSILKQPVVNLASDGPVLDLAVTLADAATLIDQTLYSFGGALQKMVEASDHLKLTPAEGQIVFSAAARNITMMTDMRQELSKTRAAARRIADRHQQELGWGDLGCPPPSNPAVTQGRDEDIGQMPTVLRAVA